MSTGRRTVTTRDLVDEAKKRIVFLSICVVGLSYLMSLTSSSVLVNLPAAVLLIVILRYLSLDYDMRRKAASYYSSKPSSANVFPQRKPPVEPKSISANCEWKKKVNSSVVEDAIDQFSRHIVSEWVTDLWYSRVTPDRQGPEELVLIINGVFGEFSSRMKNINLINLLTRDIIKLVCTHLELFRSCQAKIEKRSSLTIEQRDIELKAVLYAENKLHPALFSAGAEHKVLQHLMDGLISFTFKPEDLQCSLFRYIVRELLACAVMRPVVNLANPRFINERIESLVGAANKADKGASTEQVISTSKPNGTAKLTSQISMLLDPSIKGVELTQLKKDQSDSSTDDVTSSLYSKDPLLSIDTRSTRSWDSLPLESGTGDRGDIIRHRSGGEWGDKLDKISRRKTEALAPEHFENMWEKGRNYKTKEGATRTTEPIQQGSSARSSNSVDDTKALASQKEKYGSTSGNKLFSRYNEKSAKGNVYPHGYHNISGPPLGPSYEEDEDEEESTSSSSYSSEDEENSNITGLDSPGIKVWDGKSNRNPSVTHIHHPLENSEGHKVRKARKGFSRSEGLPKRHPGRKRSKVSQQKEQLWQEVERTRFSLGDGQDVLSNNKGHSKSEDTSGDSDAEPVGSIYSGTSASSFSLFSIPGSNNLAVNAQKYQPLEDSFFRLRCEVLGANIVKSDSKTFTVYCISVTDVNNVSWSIKRRFRHFEELHRRLKEYAEYNLHLPPKHFLSTGLDLPVIQERCKLLDIYLKRVMQLPIISGSIEVWDFLSVDSQMYSFSNSLSIIETISGDPLNSRRELRSAAIKDSSSSQIKHNSMANGSRIRTNNIVLSLGKSANELGKPSEDSGSDSSTRKLGQALKLSEDDTLHAPSEMLTDDGESELPSEWVPPNLSVPILDLVDVVFQLQDGGWIRRKAFWVAKQVLQLGMSDAFDDWVIEKIQLLRRGSFIASGIQRLEQILWPDGIFITKHPKRQRPTPSPMAPQDSPHGQPPSSPRYPPSDEETWNLEELQKQEAQRRSKLVYELMIDKAPAAIVGLVGRKEYRQCAKDLYYFIQSSVCLKQLVFDLLELLLLSAFPELDYVFQELHDEKQKFGVVEQD